MAINALNSGAKVWLADLEDANTPHWSNVIGGQVTLFDAIRRRLEFTSPEGKAVPAGHRPAAGGHRGPAPRAGISTNVTCSSTVRRPWARWSISGCTSSTTPRN